MRGNQVDQSSKYTLCQLCRIATQLLLLFTFVCSATGVSNKRYRGGEVVGVQNTNFHEVEGQSRTNPAAVGLELNDADYSDVLEVNQWIHNTHVAEIFCHPFAICLE